MICCDNCRALGGDFEPVCNQRRRVHQLSKKAQKDGKILVCRRQLKCETQKAISRGRE